MGSEARKIIDAVVAAVLEGKDLPVSLIDLEIRLGELDELEAVEWQTDSDPDFRYSNIEAPDWDDISLDWLWDDLDETRRDALKAGAKPTAKEIQLWSEAYLDSFSQDPQWDGVYDIRTIKDSRGREIVALVSITGDCGDCEEQIDDVFRNRKETLAAIKSYEHTFLERL